MVQYYTLEEAARLLGVSADDVKALAKKGELRSFQDRGTFRFRAQEVDELARRRGKGSDPDLQLGESPQKKPGDTPSSVRRRLVSDTSKPKGGDPGVFDFTLNPDDSDQVEIGQELNVGSSTSGSGRLSPSGRKLGSVSPAPKPGSDSDVRLVADGSDLGFQIASDSDVKMVDDQNPASSGTLKRPKKAASDSGVRLSGQTGSDSDVKVVGAPTSEPIGSQPPRSPSDSDIRLEGEPTTEQPASSVIKKKSKEGGLTEEIDLDAELRQAEKSARRSKKPKTKSSPDMAVSPFELSSDDAAASGAKKKKEASPESSSDFELTAMSDESSSPVEPGSDEITLQEEEVSLGELSGGTGGSGINLQDPADSGISLEQPSGSSDEIEFELSLDAGHTPKPAKGAKPAKPAKQEDSDSEFELTLDDSGSLAPLEEASDSGEKDIFETDFEVPALDEESGSQAVALEDSDTDLESSDFDLALSDDDASSDEESGSQVVALEEGEVADEGASTVARRAPRVAKADESEEVEDLVEEEEGEGVRRPAVAAAPAEWGMLPALFMIPCTILMFIVTLMGFELIHGMWGYRQSAKVTGVVTDPLARMFSDEMPKD
jgi:excisionase family DNA binding protein